MIPAGGLASDFTMGELGIYFPTGLSVAQANCHTLRDHRSRVSRACDKNISWPLGAPSMMVVLPLRLSL